jgi:hypothetical protein
VLIGTRNLDWLKLPPAIFPEPKYLAHNMDSGEFLSTYVEITSDRVPRQRMRSRRVQVSEGTLTAGRENPGMEPSPWLCVSFFEMWARYSCRIVYCSRPKVKNGTMGTSIFYSCYRLQVMLPLSYF